jgi:hypothetical protein
LVARDSNYGWYRETFSISISGFRRIDLACLLLPICRHGFATQAKDWDGVAGFFVVVVAAN